MGEKGLTTKQKKFVESYEGNATEAAEKAGYKGDRPTLAQVAHENLRKPKIVEAINSRWESKIETIVADRRTRQVFWTAIMMDENMDIRERLRASELLGKSEGDFITRAEVDVGLKLEDLVGGTLGESK